MISRTHLLFLVLFFCSCGPAQLAAQEFSGGFRAGLNSMTFSGDLEMDNGMTLEEFNRTTGFHVGATFALAFTDLVGVKANFMYTQKGGEIDYVGPGYFFSFNEAEGAVNGDVNFGDLRRELDVVNSYLEVPVLGYYKLGPLELEGGLSAAFLVNSRASGSARYTILGEDVVINYDANFLRDAPGGIVASDGNRIPGNTSGTAPTVVGAYYNSDRDDPLYRRLDFAAVVGLSYFLNNGLFVGARYQHGFTDVTNGENDLRQTRNSGGTREFNTGDKDYNRVIQASVGFRF